MKTKIAVFKPSKEHIGNITLVRTFDNYAEAEEYKEIHCPEDGIIKAIEWLL